MRSFTIKDKNSLKKLLEYGFYKELPKTEHEEARYKGDVSIVLFKSGTLLVQGKDEKCDDAVPLLRNLGIISRLPKGVMIGSDETLKGDTFGGLVVAGVLADDQSRKALDKLGVRDSKKMTNVKVQEMAEDIREMVHYSVRNVIPKDFNQIGSVTGIMNRLHREVYEELVAERKKVPVKHVVDKYPGCTVGDIIDTKAESKYVEVAAAAIIARDEAINQMAKLSKKAGFQIPWGSTHVKDALKELKKRGLPPENFVKMSFSNVKKIFG